MTAAHPQQVFSTEDGVWGGKRTLPSTAPKNVVRCTRISWNAAKLGLKRGELEPRILEQSEPSFPEAFTQGLDADDFANDFVSGQDKVNQVLVWNENFAGKTGQKNVYKKIQWQTERDNIKTMSHVRFKGLLQKVKLSKDEYQKWLSQQPASIGKSSLGGQTLHYIQTGLPISDQARFVDQVILGSSLDNSTPGELKIHPPDYIHHLKQDRSTSIFGRSTQPETTETTEAVETVRGRILYRGQKTVVGVAGYSAVSQGTLLNAKDIAGKTMEFGVEEAVWKDKNKFEIRLSQGKPQSPNPSLYSPPANAMRRTSQGPNVRNILSTLDWSKKTKK